MSYQREQPAEIVAPSHCEAQLLMNGVGLAPSVLWWRFSALAPEQQFGDSAIGALH